MKENYFELTDDKARSDYAYDMTSSLLLDKIFNERYNLKVFTNYAYNSFFGGKYNKVAIHAIRDLSSKLVNRLPNVMPKLTNDAGFIEAKAIVSPIFNKMIEEENLSELVNSIEEEMMVNNISAFEHFTNNVKEIRSRTAGFTSDKLR